MNQQQQAPNDGGIFNNNPLHYENNANVNADRILAPIGDDNAGDAGFHGDAVEDQLDDLDLDQNEDADARNSRLAMMNRLKGYINSKGVFRPQQESDDDRDVVARDNNGVDEYVDPYADHQQEAIHEALDNDLKFGLSPDEDDGLQHDDSRREEHDRLDYQQRELYNNAEGYDAGDENQLLDRRPLLADGLRGRDANGQYDAIDKHNEEQVKTLGINAYMHAAVVISLFRCSGIYFFPTPTYL